MATKNTQISFRVTEAFRKTIETECIKRDLSVQDFVTYSIQYYSKTPVDWDYAAQTFATFEGSNREQVLERQSWTNLWLKYVNSMPREKIRLMAETMKLDLRHYKSSRRKS